MSVLEHHVWRSFWGKICGLLIFVILTFFKEGIGSNLTMPYAIFLGVFVGLGSWKQGTWDGSKGTGNLESPCGLESFCIPSKHLQLINPLCSGYF